MSQIFQAKPAESFTADTTLHLVTAVINLVYRRFTAGTVFCVGQALPRFALVVLAPTLPTVATESHTASRVFALEYRAFDTPGYKYRVLAVHPRTETSFRIGH